MKRVYGYCRISTTGQNIERQKRNIIAEYPEAILHCEAYTGRKMKERPVFSKLLSQVKPGDTIVFDSVSRMSRNADEGFTEYQRLYDAGVNLVFLKEHHIDTATYKKALSSGSVPLTGSNVDIILKAVNEYLMTLAADQIRIAFEQSQKEVDDLSARTSEGIETARRNGKQIGQVAGKKLTVHREAQIKELIRQYSRDFQGQNTDAEVLAILATKSVTVPKRNSKTETMEVSAKLSRMTYYKYKRELSQE